MRLVISPDKSLGRTLDRGERIEFEIVSVHCSECGGELWWSWEIKEGVCGNCTRQRQVSRRMHIELQREAMAQEEGI